MSSFSKMLKSADDFLASCSQRGCKFGGLFDEVNHRVIVNRSNWNSDMYRVRYGVSNMVIC